MIKGLIFDFAGVIGTDGYWIYLKEKITNLEKERPYFRKLSYEVDRSDISHAQFEKAFAKKVGITIDEFWPEIHKRIVINQDLLNLIKDWKKNYKTCLLSNYTYPWLKKLVSEYNLSSLF